MRLDQIGAGAGEPALTGQAVLTDVSGGYGETKTGANTSLAYDLKAASLNFTLTGTAAEITSIRSVDKIVVGKGVSTSCEIAGSAILIEHQRVLSVSQSSLCKCCLVAALSDAEVYL